VKDSKEETMRAVSILRRWLSPTLNFVHAARLVSLWTAVVGLVESRKASITAIGRASGRRAYPKHRIKAVDRLVGNPRLHAELSGIYAASARLLLGSVKQVIVVVDWTQVSTTLWALRAAATASGRALPLYAEVHPVAKLGNRRVHRRFLAQVRALVPPDCHVVVLTDAGFGCPWFEMVVALGWDYVGRIRGLKQARYVGSDRWLPSASIRAQATTTPRSLGQHEVGKWQPWRTWLVSVSKRLKGRKSLGRRGQPRTNGADRKHARGAREPWLLATSLNTLRPRQIVALYAKRMQIEELFRDEKNTRFGWSFGAITVASNDPSRAAALIAIVALGVVAMTLLGLTIEARDLHGRFQANTIRRRRVLSLFVLGTLAAASGECLPTPTELLQALATLRSNAWNFPS
jgi:hypothetical protein